VVYWKYAYMSENDLPQTSRSRRWLGRGAVLAVAVVAGVLISDLALSLQGPRYAATVTVRPLIDNPVCVYTACPNQSAVAGGYQWIIAQANMVQSKAVAGLVHKAIKGAPSVATLRSDVRVRENNNSDSIDITYTGRNPGQAQRLAVSFAKQYQTQTAAMVLSALKDPTATTQTAFKQLANDHLTRTPRGQQLMALLNALRVDNGLANDLAANPDKGGGPPGAAQIYAPFPSLVPVQRTTPSMARATLLGAAAGLVIGLGILLALRSRGPRRPQRPRLRRRRTAVAGEA
jgi:hypothetical protein